MKLKTFVSIAGLTAFLTFSRTAGADTVAPRPNILFIFSDDHALSTIGAYGSTFGATPNIDSIARDGAVFTRSFCANSISIPSRATVLTGKLSHKNGVLTNYTPWDGSQEVFPRLLEKQAGYQTALIGKWHINPNPSDEFTYWKVLQDNGRQGFYYDPTFEAKGQDKPVKEQGYESDIVANNSIDWIKHRDPNKPFLLMMQFKDPHVHRMPAFDSMDLYKDTVFPLPVNFFDDYKTRNSYASGVWMKIAQMPEETLNIYPPYDQINWKEKRYAGLLQMTEPERRKFVECYAKENEEYFRLKKEGKLEGPELAKYKFQRYMRDYMRVVSHMDQNIGRVLQYLKDNGLDKNTIVVYSSDQGFFNGEHGWAEKRWMYEETYMMPFIIKWPGVIQPGQRIDSMIQNIDYAPTFLDAAGVKIPAEIQGKSLVPILHTGKTPADWRSSLYYHYYEEGDYNMPRIEGVRTERYKLIRYYMPDSPRKNKNKKKINPTPRPDEWELFDLEKDPHEMNNVYTDPAYADIVKSMHAELDKLRKQYDVPAQDPADVRVRQPLQDPVDNE